MNDFIDLRGASGAAYRFRLWRRGASHLPIAGNYACVRAHGSDVEVVSLGETLDLSGLRDGLPKALSSAPTQLYTRLNVARTIRRAEHEDLAAQYLDRGAYTPTA